NPRRRHLGRGRTAVEAGHDVARDPKEDLANGMVGTGADQRRRSVRALAQLVRERQLAEKRHPKLARVMGPAPVSEDLVAAPALAAEMVTHVLDHPEYRHPDLLEHRDPALDVLQCD